MSKKYRLLKDTVEYKSGKVFEYKNEHRAGSFNLPKGYYLVDKDPNDEMPGNYLPNHVENNPEWFEEIKESNYTIQSFKHKISNLLFVIVGNDLYRELGQYSSFTYNTKLLLESDDFIINSVLYHDGDLFSIGEEVYFVNQPEGRLFVSFKIDNFFIRKDGAMLVQSKDCEMVEDITTISKVKCEKKYTSLRAISVKDLKDYPGIKKMCDLWRESAINFSSEPWYISKEETESPKLKDIFITSDSVVCSNGDKVYGISLQASGNDKWREQVLPFKGMPIGQNRVWFSTKEKANEYLIENSSIFSIKELYSLLFLNSSQYSYLTKIAKEKI